MTEDQKNVIRDFQKENNVKVKKEGKYFNFYCKCGSEMWNNIFGDKKSSKSPDLRCKNESCPHGKGKYSNSVWVKDEVRDALGIKKRAGSSNKSGGSKSSGGYSGDRYGNDIPVSMYAAWAKDVAIHLAKETGVKAHDEFDTLYRTCLQNMQATLEWFKTKTAKKATPEDQQVKDVDDVDDLDLGDTPVDDPEDVDDSSLDDLDDDDTGSKDVADEDSDFGGLDDVDL